MFIRRIRQQRQGRIYTYYSLVESVRTPEGRVRQRIVCYLGRLDNLRPPDWLRVAERLPDPAWLPVLQQEVGYTPPPPTGPIRSVTLDPHSIAWSNPRRLADVHVGLCSWQLLGLDWLLERLVGRCRTRVPLPLVAALIAVNRLVEPRSELGIFRWWPTTALPELLGVPRDRLHLNLLYRCLSEVERHQAAIEQHLVERGRDLFGFANDLVLYDLTSTYFEGRLAGNAKAQRGYSRDHRPDCKQLCLALAVNREGFPLGFESLPGNRRDAVTLTPAIERLEQRCGGLRRLICFDRGMATEANLRHWRQTRAERTYEDYRDWLNLWVKLHGDKRARDIRSIDLEEWKTELASRDLAPSTLNHAVVAVKRCWSWGTENELLPRNPLARVKKLYAEGRERIFTPDELRLLLRHSDALFRQVLLFLRLTGVRPSEFRRLAWDQVDFENHVLVIRRNHKSRRTAKERRARIVHLPPIAENMLKWRLKKHGRTQRVFLNHFGLPWSPGAKNRCQ